MARVLVVDDDGLVRNLIATIIRNGRHQVRCADGAEAALQLLTEPVPYDLVLVDLSLAGTSGMLLITAIRKLWPNIPVVAMTGGLEDYVEDEVAGIDGVDVKQFLRKPFSQQALREAVRVGLQDTPLHG